MKDVKGNNAKVAARMVITVIHVSLFFIRIRIKIMKVTCLSFRGPVPADGYRLPSGVSCSHD